MISQCDVANQIKLGDDWVGNAEHVFVVINLRLLDAGDGNVGGGD